MKLALAALFTSCATISFAQNQTCAPRELVIERLSDQYGERRQSMGINSNGAMVEMFASPLTGSWTITVTTPHGLTCLAASGQSYEALTDVAPIGEPT